MAARKNVKINLNGEKHKVPIPVFEFVKRLSELIRNHEMALFMWKYIIHDKKGKAKDIEIAQKDLYSYIMRIPNAEQIINNMNQYHDESLKVMKKGEKIKNEEEKKKFFAQEIEKLKRKDPWIVK